MKLSAIGSGRWGRILLSKFHALSGVHLVYGHRNREQLEADYGLRFTEDIDQLIAESDAVVIATPPLTHYELTRRVLEADKHVFVEKPITLDSGRARELVQLAEERQRVLMVGHVLCYSSAYQALKQLPGRPIAASACFLKTSTPEKEINAYWNFGIHMVALAVALDVPLENFQLEASDTASENRRVFELTTRTEDGHTHTRQWDFLAPEHQEDMLMTECAHFLDCLHSGQRPRTDGAHALRVIEWLERISPDYRK